MKKRALVIYMVLIGSFFMVGCSNNAKSVDTNKNTTQNNTAKGDNRNNDSNPAPKSDKKNDALDKGEITEDDIVKKEKWSYNGQDYIKYELKDGSMLIVPEGEDDLGKINESIKNDSSEPKKVD